MWLTFPTRNPLLKNDMIGYYIDPYSRQSLGLVSILCERLVNFLLNIYAHIVFIWFLITIIFYAFKYIKKTKIKTSHVKFFKKYCLSLLKISIIRLVIMNKLMHKYL